MEGEESDEVTHQGRRHVLPYTPTFLEDCSNQDKPIGELARVTTQVSRRFISVTNTALRTTSDEIHNNLIIFDAIELSEPDVIWFNTHLTSPATTSRLGACLIDGTAVGVSDDSYFPIEEVGICGWIIATPDGCEWIEGGGIIPGLQSD